MFRFTDLCNKDVINIKDGCKLGCVADIDIDPCTGFIAAVIVAGQSRFFGLLGREEDCIIPWKHVEKISTDVILVCIERQISPRRKKKSLFF